VALGVGEGFGFVADEVVDIWDDAVELVFEELRDKGGGQGEDEGLPSIYMLAVIPYFTSFFGVRYTLLFAAASSARAKIAGTETVKWYPPT
jgi:hypothetical protein